MTSASTDALSVEEEGPSVSSGTSDISSNQDGGVPVHGGGVSLSKSTAVGSLQVQGLSSSAPVISTRAVNKGGSGGEGVSVTVEDVKGLKFGHQSDKDSEPKKVRLGEYTDELLRQDLNDLVERNRKTKTTAAAGNDEEKDSDELSPLLAASGRGLSDKKLEALKRYISKQEAENRKKKEREKEIPGSPTAGEGEGGGEGMVPSTIVQPPSPSTHQSLQHIPDGIGQLLSQLDLGDSSSLQRGSSSRGGMLSYSQSVQSSHATLTDPNYYSDILASSQRSQSLPSIDQFSSSLRQPPSPFDQDYTKLDDYHDDDIDDDAAQFDKQGPSVQQEFNTTTSDGLDYVQDGASVVVDGDDDCLEESSLDVETQKSVPFLEPQPETVSMNIPNMEVVRASGHRVSERSPLNFLRLQPFPPFYNELNGELDDVTIEQMDKVLQVGDDIQEIYKELSETLQKDYLEIAKDPFLEPHLQGQINMSTIYASNSLQRRKMLRVINEDLSHHGDPPWRGRSRREWLMNSSKQDKKPEATPNKHLIDFKRRKALEKLEEESAALSTGDYQKYIAQQGSDFLGVIHHMYNSSGSDSEDEERERKKQEQLRLLHLQLQKKERKRLEMLEKKTLYVPGQWNANTVLMGGLGKAPENLELEEETHIDSNTVTIDTKQLQDKLEVIWNRLQVSAKDRIDMIITYSDPTLVSSLSSILNLWEKSCDTIEKRENALEDLEEFERNSSSPSRHFTKRGSKLRRAEEKTRSILNYKLDSIEKLIVTLARRLGQYNSRLTLKGQDYLEKMSMDRTEMLYFLNQQHRREVLLPSIKYLNSTTHYQMS